MLLLLATGARAQDTHYWNIQYGTRATLLGGAVIGSVSDRFQSEAFDFGPDLNGGSAILQGDVSGGLFVL